MITALALAVTGALVAGAFWLVPLKRRRERARFAEHADQAAKIANEPGPQS